MTERAQLFAQRLRDLDECIAESKASEHYDPKNDYWTHLKEMEIQAFAKGDGVVWRVNDRPYIVFDTIDSRWYS
jgi:hypothetical protein